VKRSHFVIAVVAAAAGCSKPNQNSQPEPASKPITPVTAEIANTPTPGAANNAAGKYTPTTNVQPIVNQMSKEAAARPKAGVLAEPLFDALEAKANIKLDKRQQYLGKTIGAAYCAGGDSTPVGSSPTLTVAMCEYPDEAAAKAGLDMMNKDFPIAGAHREEHRAAVLTIVANADDPRIDTAFKVFESL
jgi:hypothetical protein